MMIFTVSMTFAAMRDIEWNDRHRNGHTRIVAGNIPTLPQGRVGLPSYRIAVAPFGLQTLAEVVPQLLVWKSGAPSTSVALMPVVNGAEYITVLLLPKSAT